MGPIIFEMGIAEGFEKWEIKIQNRILVSIFHRGLLNIFSSFSANFRFLLSENSLIKSIRSISQKRKLVIEISND